MRMTRVLFGAALCLLSGMMAFAQPHQGGGGDSGCRQGTITLTDVGTCGANQVLRFQKSNPQSTIACPGEEVWIDIVAERFNIEGTYFLGGFIDFDPVKLSYQGFELGPDVACCSNIFTTATAGHLEVSAYHSQTSPDNLTKILLRVKFLHRVSTPVNIWNSTVPWSNDPNTPLHIMQAGTYCWKSLLLSYVP